MRNAVVVLLVILGAKLVFKGTNGLFLQKVHVSFCKVFLVIGYIFFHWKYFDLQYLKMTFSWSGAKCTPFLQ